ncbi:type II toxin-antitoxin system RelE/ParE family toxin [Polymorphospora sp. NPDC050346]|uniref:type II toxin-antitoxin system RelE/ParE family toxin n=1 Tax=Polymorphospora sp. NPDC050346 TaxID=3155780 RepID=UPI0033DB7394
MIQANWPRSGREIAIRVLFVFDPSSQAVLLVGGNKAGNWARWYKTAIPAAEIAYETWLAFERKRREES